MQTANKCAYCGGPINYCYGSFAINVSWEKMMLEFCSQECQSHKDEFFTPWAKKAMQKATRAEIEDFRIIAERMVQ
jgi:hypothetical protein